MTKKTCLWNDNQSGERAKKILKQANNGNTHALLTVEADSMGRICIEHTVGWKPSSNHPCPESRREFITLMRQEAAGVREFLNELFDPEAPRAIPAVKHEATVRLSQEMWQELVEWAHQRVHEGTGPHSHGLELTIPEDDGTRYVFTTIVWDPNKQFAQTDYDCILDVAAMLNDAVCFEEETNNDD